MGQGYNYRRIAVSDGLNKVFTKILNTRIYNYLTLKRFWSPNEHGFVKGCRTEDNAFIIQFSTNMSKLEKEKYTLPSLTSEEFLTTLTGIA